MGYVFGADTNVLAFQSAVTYVFPEEYTILMWVNPTIANNGTLFIKEKHDGTKNIKLELDTNNFIFSIKSDDYTPTISAAATDAVW